MKRIAVLVGLMLVVGLGAFMLVGGLSGAGLSGAGLSGAGGPAKTAAPVSPQQPDAAEAPPSGSEGPAAESQPPPSAPPSVLARVAIVPVTNFRSTATSTSADEVRAVVAGTSDRYDRLELVKADAPAILAALGLNMSTPGGRVVTARNAAALARDLAGNRKRLAIIRADSVTPGVRALAWGDKALFGSARVKALRDWLLVADLRVPGDKAYAPRYDPRRAWTLVAGGDILLDRGVAKTVKVEGRGVDFPFNGGTAEITGRCRDCSPLGWDLPYTRRTGNAGAMRRLLRGADLAIANFENPAPDNFRYHTKGTVFSADPRLIDGLRNAGIDYVSLANNHIRDAGGQGILDTIENLDDRGIRHSGAGRNLAAARRPAMIDVRGTKVAILAYDTIARNYGATASRAGSAQLTPAAVKQDVAAARRAGARAVIVFPHWGTEYDPTPFAGQQRLARACIEAGADMVIGNHAHWAGAMEVYRGKPIWYALGNFVFDQTWSEPTMEGITLELTFSGARLVQVRMRPHIILDRAQPNFLDPAADGRVVMGQVFQASRGLLPW